VDLVPKKGKPGPVKNYRELTIGNIDEAKIDQTHYQVVG